jgi:hypothetical protein
MDDEPEVDPKVDTMRGRVIIDALDVVPGGKAWPGSIEIHGVMTPTPRADVPRGMVWFFVGKAYVYGNTAVVMRFTGSDCVITATWRADLARYEVAATGVDPTGGDPERVARGLGFLSRFAPTGRRKRRDDPALMEEARRIVAEYESIKRENPTLSNEIIATVHLGVSPSTLSRFREDVARDQTC